MKVNYPNPDIKVQSNRHDAGSRGMEFENELNKSNEYYRNSNKAIIYKKPTPVRIVKVNYPERRKAKIVEAYYQIPSTTDYNGIYRGKYIDYEAKETLNLSFPFKNIFPHQLKHLKQIDDHGGIAFIIIFFKKVDKIFIIDIKQFLSVYNNKDTLHKQSIHYKDIIKLGGKPVTRGYTPMVDYLKQVDEMYFG